MSKILLLLSLLLVVGCGNVDRGKTVRTSRTKTDSANTTVLPTSSATFDACKAFAVYGGADPFFAQTFGGSQACAGASQLNLVKLKVTASFPSNTRFCLVPLAFQGAFTATCFAINGQAEITLSSEKYTALTLLRESDLAAYQNYLIGQTSAYPAMAYVSLR
ncbi:MAG: hypothetical protein EOP11_10065 [Proteobacteria bacterium]|nr:MAG: hypothetical protein EOP11_10065 [Pseudomonadota bacterium]